MGEASENEIFEGRESLPLLSVNSLKRRTQMTLSDLLARNDSVQVRDLSFRVVKQISLGHTAKQ